MKKKLILSLMLALVLTFGAPSFVQKADAAYKYRVTVYAGNQGHFGSNKSNKVWTKEFSPGETVEIDKDVVGFKLDNSKYYFRGFRVAGHDNDEVEYTDETGREETYTNLNFSADYDVDYEIAYGLKGAMVAYKINYVDSSGKTLHASDTHYGMKGDKPVVSYRYIEGYYPNAYTQGKKLVADEKENVFTFTYTAIPANTTTTVRPAGTTGTVSNAAGSSSTRTAASSTNRSTTSSTTNRSTTASTSRTGTTTTGTGTSSSSSSSNRTSSSSSSSANRSSDDDSSSSSSSSSSRTESDDTTTFDDDAVPLAQQPEQYIDIDEEPATLGEFISDHKVPFIIGGIALLGAIGGLIAGLIVHSKNKKKKEAEAEEEAPAQPAV